MSGPLWFYSHADLWKHKNPVPKVRLWLKSKKKTCFKWGFWICKKSFIRKEDQDNTREFTESVQSTNNYNCLSSSINQPKNYPSTYSDSFSQILSVKNHPNFIFCQFRIFVYGPTPKNKNVEFTESLRKFYLLYQWWILVPVHSLITWYYFIQYRLFVYSTDYFLKLLFPFELFFEQKIGTSFAQVKIDLNPS